MTPRALRRLTLVVPLIAFVLSGCAADRPKNVILFIGDGMGAGQVQAARAYQGRPLAFETFEGRGLVSTHSADNEVTDSAAAATAMATGHKVDNHVLSVAIPANADYAEGAPMLTVLEEAARRGKSSGLVTTTSITHATPAAFAAHVSARAGVAEIAAQYLADSRPQLLLGGGGQGMSPEAAAAAGYRVVMDRGRLQAVRDDGLTVPRLSGQFGSGHMPYEADHPAAYESLPRLSEMTATALALLDNDRDGFFLMVEGGRIDMACHDNRLDLAVAETLELERAVQAALRWAGGRADTLIIVVADHETGGLAVERDSGAGELPGVSWSGKSHTGAAVQIWARGRGAHAVCGRMDNTEIHHIILNPGARTCPGHVSPCRAVARSPAEARPAPPVAVSGDVSMSGTASGRIQE